MHYLTIFVVASLAWASLGQGPNTCRNFTVGNFTTPRPGNDLNYCRRSTAQCCSNGYFESEVSHLRRNALLDGLREQIEDTVGDTLEDIEEDMERYVNVFVPRFVQSFARAFNGSGNSLSTYTDELRRRFYIQRSQSGEVNFTADGFIDSIFQAQVNLIIQQLFRPRFQSFDGQQANCIRSQLLALNNTAAKNRLVRAIEAFRRSATAIRRINTWYKNTFLQNLGNYFTPLDACVNAFINLTCESCVRNIPPLCRGVCNSVIYGCYAVFQNGLRGQFDVLWNVTSQLVNISRNAIHNATTLPGQLLRVNISNRTEIIRIAGNIAGTCNLTPLLPNPPNGRKRRQTDDDDDDDDDDEMFGRILRNSTRLLRNGVFDYDKDGPEYCERRYQSNRGCWNGNSTVQMFIGTFNATTIEGQVNNPYLNVSVSELRTQVEGLPNLVTDYLQTEEFQEVQPQQLVVPEDQPSTPSSGNLKIASVLGVLLAALLVVLL